MTPLCLVIGQSSFYWLHICGGCNLNQLKIGIVQKLIGTKFRFARYNTRVAGHVGLTQSKSFAAIGIAATARSADDGARCASNEPPVKLQHIRADALKRGWAARHPGIGCDGTHQKADADQEGACDRSKSDFGN
jgi:hypothetical protein